ncbi:hypothetical protein ACFE04_010870 [Oxalis oulophora]
MKPCSGIDCLYIGHQNGYSLAAGIALFVAVLVVLILVFMSFFYGANYVHTQMFNFILSRHNNDDDDDNTLPAGLDEYDLRSLPRLRYAEVKGSDWGNQVANSCSICLEDYMDDDMLCLLPRCDHYFHMKCVKIWLEKTASCPICRCRPVNMSPVRERRGQPAEQVSRVLVEPPSTFMQ